MILGKGVFVSKTTLLFYKISTKKQPETVGKHGRILFNIAKELFGVIVSYTHNYLYKYSVLHSQLPIQVQCPTLTITYTSTAVIIWSYLNAIKTNLYTSTAVIICYYLNDIKTNSYNI